MDTFDALLRDGNTPLREATLEQLLAALRSKVAAFVLAMEIPADDAGDTYRCHWEGSTVNALGLARYAEGYLDRLIFEELP